MGQPYLEQEIYHTYLVMEIDEGTDRDKYGIKILQNNRLSYFLPFELRSKNGISRYYYDIPSDESLKNQLEKGMTLQNIELFAVSLLGAFDEIDEYLMDENDIFLEPESIYWSQEGRYLFTYYPGYKGNVPRQLKDIAALFLKAVDYTCNEAVRRVYEFYHLACNENSSLKKLREYVLAGCSRETAAKYAGARAGEYAGACAGKYAGERAGECAGEYAGESAGEYAGERAGETAGAPAGEYAGVRAGETAGAHAGDIAGGPAGKAAGVPVPWGDRARRNTVRGGALSKDTACGAKAYSHTGALKNQRSFSLWMLIGAVCLAETAAGVICFKAFSRISRGWLIAGVAIAMVLTLAGGILWKHIEGKREDEDDFWSPEDYISYDGKTTTGILNATTLLEGREPELTLKSVNPQLCGHLYISTLPAMIGKEVADSQCRISVPTVSRRHARLEYKGEAVYVTDLRSSNGTFINGELIAPMKPALLAAGDHVIFSDVEFIFEKSGERG